MSIQQRDPGLQRKEHPGPLSLLGQKIISFRLLQETESSSDNTAFYDNSSF